MKFYLTFGQQNPFRDGWIEIIAEDYMSARQLVFDVFSDRWSGLYRAEEFDTKHFPAGKLGELIA
jgi:hypothetical protein